MISLFHHIIKLKDFNHIPKISLGQRKDVHFNIYVFWGRDNTFYIHPNYRNVHTIHWLFKEDRLL